MARLDGKVALISGGARGQGATEAALFASEGATVVITDLLDEDGAKTAADVGATYLHHDVTAEADWARVVEEVKERHGRIDVLVNNAGVFRVLPMAMTTEEEYRRIIDVNQVGVFLGMKAVTPVMVDQRSGSIVNISSVAGLRGGAGTFAYTASKWAVRGMTKAAASELAPFGVRVNSVHPGIIETKMIDEIRQFGDEMWSQLIERIPMGRSTGPEDVARLVLFLASDDSAYSTGSEFVVDGGMTA